MALVTDARHGVLWLKTLPIRLEPSGNPWYAGDMTTIPFDTHRLITRLKESGFSEKQAEGIAGAMQEMDLSQLTTKGDLRELQLRLETGMKELELRMIVKLGSIIAVATALLAALKVFS